jgi:hypothetical protein
MPVARVEPAITVEFVRDGFFHPASVGLTSAFTDEHEFHHVTVPPARYAVCQASYSTTWCSLWRSQVGGCNEE